MGTVAELMRPPKDPFHERLVAAFPQIRRFLPLLIEAIEFDATETAQPVLTAYRALGDWLADKPRTTTLPEAEVPLEVISSSWEPHVRDAATGTVNRADYACAVLDALRTRLRRRDIYAPASTRWGDPRAELLTPEVWADQRDALCDELALDTDPTAVLTQLTATLDTAWRNTAAGLPTNSDLRIEHRDGRDEIVLTPLDADDEPESLIALRAQVEALLTEWRSPICPWRCTAGPDSSTSTPTWQAPPTASPAWPKPSPRCWCQNRATSGSPRSPIRPTRR
jgi:hypothetical protein